MVEIRLTLTVLKDTFAVCRLDPENSTPDWATQPASFISITRTPGELSIVVPQHIVQGEIQCERDWKCLQVAGPLGFNEVGILSSLLAPLAEARISIFAVSSYDTDYLLVKEKDLETAIAVLYRSGHWIGRS